MSEKNCTCGEPHISKMVIHCYDGKPCYLKPVSTQEQDNCKEGFDKIHLKYFRHWQQTPNWITDDIYKEFETLLSSQAHALKEQMKECVDKNKTKSIPTGSMWKEIHIHRYFVSVEKLLSAIESIEI